MVISSSHADVVDIGMERGVLSRPAVPAKRYQGWGGQLASFVIANRPANPPGLSKLP